MLKEIFAIYKSFEKCFFKVDKTKDMIAYIRLKHQFRLMLTFGTAGLLPALYMLIVHHFIVATPFYMLPVILIGFRTRSFNTMRVLTFLLAVMVPLKYLPTSEVLLAPTAIMFGNLHVLVQTQSTNFMMVQMGVEAIIFYFYGANRMMTKIKEMRTEELTEGARIAIIYTFMMCFVNLVCMKLFYSQFSSLLRKVDTLKEDLSTVNSQLNDQNLKLQSNLETKDVFIYTFSHELKNTLNGLLGNLFLAFDSTKDAQVLQFLSSAKVCGEVLKNFVHNILDSGKLENGNLEVSPERKDVMHFMQSVWTICGRIIQNKRLKGYLEIDKNVPRYLELDEQRMIQIILNLVSNAVKFTEKGQVRLRIRWQTTSKARVQNYLLEGRESQISQSNRIAIAESEEESAFFETEEFPNNLEASSAIQDKYHLVTEYQKKFITDPHSYKLGLTKSNWNHAEILSSTLLPGSKGILRVQVIDSGCGIATEDQIKLFQKFTQVSSVTGQRKVGTGLGLWICKELANRLGGDIKIRSVVGIGSIFELTVRTQVSEITTQPRLGHHASDQGSNNSLSILSFEQKRQNMLKILIADDDSFNIELMKNYLNKFGISYICAYDGEEAVSLFKKHQEEICFIITDNFMPKKTGVEAAGEISAFLKEKRRHKIPILCISGDLKVNVGESGITSVIQKPINFDRLKEELKHFYPQLVQLTQLTDGGDK